MSNAAGTVYSNAVTLTVTSAGKPVITTQPANVSGAVGSSVKVSVKASGSGLTYQWQYRTSSTGSWNSSTMTGAKTATMTIPVTAARNGYQYRCKVTNATGTVYSNAATLTVY